MLRNFDSPNPIQSPTASQGQTLPSNQKSTRVIRMVGASRGYLFRDPDEWEWTDLRDYVVDHITEVAGPFDFDPTKADAVFRAFFYRHSNAPAIARYAFDILNGLWYSEPIGINRFYKGQDPYFAEPITRLLEAAE